MRWLGAKKIQVQILQGLVGHWRILSLTLLREGGHWSILSQGMTWPHLHAKQFTLASIQRMDCKVSEAGSRDIRRVSFSRVQLFVTPWTIAHGILQARILEWVAFPISKGSSQPRNQTQVSHIAGGFFTSWATKEAEVRRLSKMPWETTVPDQGGNSELFRGGWTLSIMWRWSRQGFWWIDVSCVSHRGLKDDSKVPGLEGEKMEFYAL